jgi:ABC-type dipeptide/oligopeptide/nickel transport system permease subunit
VGTPEQAGRVSFAVGAVFLAMLGFVATLAPQLAPYDPTLPSGQPLLPPGPAHLLGTNDIGQDLLSQWLWGARSSLLVAVLVALLSTGFSWTIGLVAATWRRTEGLLVGLMDLLLALPPLPLYLLVLALLGTHLHTVIMVLGLLSWPAFGRIVRAQVVATRNATFVEAAYALGARRARVALVHVLPATLSLLPAKLVLTVRFAIFAEATLAFLGAGDASAPSWGTTLGWAFTDPLLFSRAVWPWWVLPPAFGIVVVVVSTTCLGTGLEGWIVAGRPADRQPQGD